MCLFCLLFPFFLEWFLKKMDFPRPNFRFPTARVVFLDRLRISKIFQIFKNFQTFSKKLSEVSVYFLANPFGIWINTLF